MLSFTFRSIIHREVIFVCKGSSFIFYFPRITYLTTKLTKKRVQWPQTTKYIDFSKLAQKSDETNTQTSSITNSSKKWKADLLATSFY